MVNRKARALGLALLLVVSGSRWASTQSQVAAVITSPKEQFGANVGDDYFLANYTQIEAYWKRLDRESDRMSLVDIGRTVVEARTRRPLFDRLRRSLLAFGIPRQRLFGTALGVARALGLQPKARPAETWPPARHARGARLPP